MQSNVVTAENAYEYDGDLDSLAGIDDDLIDPLHHRVLAANGKGIGLEPGQRVIVYGPFDLGVMDAGEYERWFGGR